MSRHSVSAVVCLFPYELRKICWSAGIVCLALMPGTLWAQVVAGQNINMVSGTQWPSGDPFLQRQNEPSMAVSSRNPEHLLAGANDYRTVDIPNSESPNETGDAWLGVFTSIDGGETWKSTLLPGYPQDTSAVGTASPLHQFTVATDPTARAGTHGLFYLSGLVFNRGTHAPSGVFVSVFQDQNNKGNGNAAILQGSSGAQNGNSFAYISATLLDSGTTGQFLDKPWVAVDIPRTNRTATCKINGQTIQSGYVYIVWTQFTPSQNPSSKIKVSVSTNCGATWSHPEILSQSEKLAQGTVATIDPSNGNVHVAWRQIADGNQPDAIQYAYSTNGGNSFVSTSPVVTFVKASTSYPSGSAFDEPSGNEFRSLDVPSIAVDASSRVWLAYSQRVNGPTSGTYGSRIMVTTLPSGSKTWGKPYVVDASSPTTTAYAHQFMPALSFAFGKMMLAWYDSRNDNQESVLTCPSGNTCTDLSQLTAQRVPIPGSTLVPTNTGTYATVFTPNILDPNSGIRHTIDVFGAMIDPTTQTNTPVPSFQVSQYPFWVNDVDNEQVEQGFFNPPNLPLFAQGTLPFVGDYIDIGAQNIVPSGTGWAFNTQGKDPATGATLAPDFHITWTDNRDVVPPPIVNGSQNWTIYAPPNNGTGGTSTYSGSGNACPTCSTVQPACTTVAADNGTESAYSGDRNENVYTSRISNGLIVRFRENAKQLSSTVPTRSFSLLVKNTVSPLSTTPLGAPSYYRILLGVTSTSGQTPTCTITGGTASLSPTGCTAFLDIAVNPKTTFTQSITVTSSATAPSVPVLVAQTTGIPASGQPPIFAGLQALATINSDPSNPSVANPDFLSTDNSDPDASSPYGALSITAGETYDPTVDGPPDPTINTPKIGAPLINTPKIATPAINTPKIDTPTIVTVANNSPIYSVQVVNPTIVDTINTPKINTPKINTPKIVSPEIFTPKITDPSDGGVTDYTWNVNNKGNTSSSYNTSEFAKSTGVQCCPASCSSNPNSCGFTCSVCQLVQHKVYESPVANRDSNTGNPTCALNVQQETIVVANISDPAFVTSGTGSGNPSNPSNSTLSLSPGEGNRVTLRVVAPPASQTTPFKTVAAGQNNDSNGQAATSLTIQTTALPVAVVGQPYIGASLSSLGGIGATEWSIPANPSDPVPVSGAGPFTLPVSPLSLTESGQISTGTVTQATGTYPFFVQVQDSAKTSGSPTPSFDVQELTIEVNQFSISSVDPMITNEVGSTGYMKAGDQATVSVTISNQGPATATSVAPTLTVNEASGGTPSGPTPIVTCGSPSPGPSTISGNGNQTFNFNCTAMSGNGYVTFTAKATGQYVNSPAATVTAIAIPVSEPQLTPSSTAPNIIVDTVPPTLTFNNASPAPNQYGWNKLPVTFSYTTGDNLSGVNTSVPNPLVLSTEGKNLSGQVTVIDYAKNTAVFTAPTSSMPTVNIDKTPPTIIPSSAYTAGTWTNQNVTVQFNCTDNLSGPLISGGVTNPIITGIPVAGATLTYTQQGALTSIATVTLTAETTGATLTANCQDFAGNNAVQAQFGPIMIDKTPPALSATAVAGLNPYTAGAWTNQNVRVTYTCVDDLSPVANSGVAFYAPLQQIFNTETANGSSTGTCTDKAGNVSTVTFSPIMIDQTPPVLTVATTNADSSAYTPGKWTNQSVTVKYTCNDNASLLHVNSGVAAGSPTAPQTFTQGTTSAGTSTTGTCSDNAGNVATNAPLSSGTILIDKTPPTVTAVGNLGSSNGPVYTPGTWTNQSVVVTFSCNDALSGPQPGSLTGNTTYGGQGTYTANGSCQDVAGNVGNGSFGPVEIDTTTPSVMITAPTQTTYILNQPITPSFTCGDNSGGDTVTCTPTPAGSPYNATPVGPATFSVHAVDQAGNATNPDPSVSYLVIYKFTGFQPPLQNAVRTPYPSGSYTPIDSGYFTLGTTVPVAWQLQDASNTVISDLTTLTSIVAYPNATCTGTSSGNGTILYNSSTNTSAFSFANNSFTFNWSTTGMSAGCYNVVLTTNDTAQWSTIVHLTTDTLAGFDAPLTTATPASAPSNSGTFDTGSTIPVMWALTLPNGQPDASQSVNLSNVSVYANTACAGAPPSGASSTVLYDRVSNTGTFNFEPSTAVYTVNWATGGASAGCYDIVVTLSDQSVYSTMVTLAAPGGTTTLLQYNFDNVPMGAGSQTAPASFAAPNVTGGSFGYSRNNPNGMSNNGCVIALCIDPAEVASGDYYSFSIANNPTISNASISFREFNNDCQQTSCSSGQSFVLQYDTDPSFSSPQPLTVGSFTPPAPGYMSFSFLLGSLPANTFYFRITATGTDQDGTAQYVLDNVTITGSH